MGYRVYLHNGDGNLEIRDETPKKQFDEVKGTEKNEYPDYIVDKEAMLKIITFYQKKLEEVGKTKYEKLRNKESTFDMFWYYVGEYFSHTNDKDMILDSSHFLLQYFLLVDIYKNTDWENTTLKITHG